MGFISVGHCPPNTNHLQAGRLISLKKKQARRFTTENQNFPVCRTIFLKVPKRRERTTYPCRQSIIFLLGILQGNNYPGVSLNLTSHTFLESLPLEKLILTVNRQTILISLLIYFCRDFPFGKLIENIFLTVFPYLPVVSDSDCIEEKPVVKFGGFSLLGTPSILKYMTFRTN